MVSRQRLNHLTILLLLVVHLHSLSGDEDVCVSQAETCGDVVEQLSPGPAPSEGEGPGREDSEHGYLLFCLCMGRFGNKIEHLLGAIAFSAAINRTLVIPPFPEDHNIPFTDYFKLDPILTYHRAITMETFMSEVAPLKWPPEERRGYCWSRTESCDMKPGNPHRSFWDEFDIYFIGTQSYTLSYTPGPDSGRWGRTFPPDKHPVLALKGSPSPYPMRNTDYHLQRLLHWSDDIQERADDFIKSNFNGKEFIGIHLRNGNDWSRACRNAAGQQNYMASPQCLGKPSTGTVTMEMCLPNITEISRVLRKTVRTSGIRDVFIATDHDAMIRELGSKLSTLNIRLVSGVSSVQLDLAVLGQSRYFIGNCVSSVSSFVTRERMLTNKPTTFWGLN